jgi:hypothetical protein
MDDIFIFISKDKMTFFVECPYNKIIYVSKYFVETIMPVCFLERGYYILHASCITKNNQSILLCADSCVGKSTLAYKFHTKGWDIISDDIICINLFHNNIILNGLLNMPLKLSMDSLNLMGIPINDNIAKENDKYLLNDINLNCHKTKLKTIFFLFNDKQKHKISYEKLQHNEILHYLLKHSIGLWGIEQSKKAKIILDYVNMVKRQSFAAYKISFFKEYKSIEKIYNLISNLTTE